MLGIGATDIHVLHAKLVHPLQLPTICVYREVHMTVSFVLVMQDTMHLVLSRVLSVRYVDCKPQKPMPAKLVAPKILFYASAIQGTMETVRIAGHVSSAVPIQL